MVPAYQVKVLFSPPIRG